MQGKIVMCAAAMTAMTGCASIVKGGDQDISIQSTPTEARYEVRRKGETNPLTSGVTPGKINLEKGAGYFKGAEYQVTISKPGFQPQVVDVSSRISGWYIGGNALIGGMIGWIGVDPATGAMWTLSPEAIQATLANSEVASGEASAAALMAPISATGVSVETQAAPVALGSVTAAPTTVAMAAPAPVLDPNAPMVRAASVLRAQPKAQTRGLQSVTAGTPVNVLGSLSNTEGQWFYVSAAGANGWLHVGELTNVP